MRKATPGRPPVRQRQARHEDLPGRNLRPCARRGARGDAAEAMQLINDHEYGNGTCIFTPRRRGRSATSPTTIQVGMVGVNVRLPCRWPTTRSAAGSAALFGDLRAYAPDAVALLYASARPSRSAGPRLAACVRGTCSASRAARWKRPSASPVQRQRPPSGAHGHSYA